MTDEKLAEARNELAGIYQGAKGSAENKGAEHGWSLRSIAAAEAEFRFEDIAAALCARDAEIAAKDAEIERLRVAARQDARRQALAQEQMLRAAIAEFLAAEDEVEKEVERARVYGDAAWSSAPTVRRIYAVKALRALADKPAMEEKE